MSKINIFLCVLCGIIFCITDAKCEIRMLCNKGYYVAKCDNFEIGTNILKSLQEEGETSTVSYYDWSRQYNVENLRNLFAGYGPIRFYNREGTELTTINNHNNQIVKMRNNFLNKVCANAVDIVCVKCPGNAYSADSYNSTEHSSQSTVQWGFSSFANCYMNKFTDNTGTYTMSGTAGQSTSCFYSNEITGNTYNFGTNTSGPDVPGNNEEY